VRQPHIPIELVNIKVIFEYDTKSLGALWHVSIFAVDAHDDRHYLRAYRYTVLPWRTFGPDIWLLEGSF
jgi:hypothetical protein